jgi:putative membrane protein
MARRLLFTVVLWIVEAAALIGLASVLGGFSIAAAADGVAMVVVISVLNAVLWPLALWLTLPFAFFSVGLFTLLLNACMVWLAGWILGGVTVDFWDGIFVAFVLALVQVVLGALFNQVDDSYDRRIVKRAARRERTPLATEVPGVLFLEIDGLAEPILRKALAAGMMPHLARWLEDGTHRLLRWEPDLSSQTGASQSGILLGNNENVVAFRWWDRERKRLVSCSSLKDVAELEVELSHGNGLLHPDGASRANLFSGDAGDWTLTSSKTAGWQTRSHDFFGFFRNAYNIPRVFLLMAWEIVLEACGQLRQWAGNTRPRIRPHFSYFFVRAGTNVYLQLLTVYAVLRDVYLGVPAVYATFFAYDEVAHHSGIDGRAAHRILRRLDNVFARIERATQDAPRPYRMVILSDHGQSQGSTFLQRQDVTLGQLVERLAGSGVEALETNEGIHRLDVALTESAEGGGSSARATKAVLAGTTQHEPDEATRPAVALASGCLGLVYFTEHDRRLTREQLDALYPGLMNGLVSNPDIGFVMVATELEGPIVLGLSGTRWLDGGWYEGDDPLADYGPHVAHHLRRTNGFRHVPDILCNGRFDAETGEVPAFEELVGSHGGLGGTQVQPFLLYPSSLELGETEIVGAEALHRVLKPWAQAAMLGGVPARESRHEHGDDGDEVQLSDERLDHREGVAEVPARRVVAVADGGESDVAEVEAQRARAVSALGEEGAGAEHGDGAVEEHEQQAEQEVDGDRAEHGAPVHLRLVGHPNRDRHRGGDGHRGGQ